MAMPKCKLFGMLCLPLQMHHQPTPAYCHGDKDIARDVWFGHRHQLPVQVDCFSCHPEEDSQEEVVHECRDHSTEHRNSSWDSADDEGDVQPQQSKAEIQQQLHMDSISEFPEWCMWGVVRWWCSTNVLPCVVMHRISSISQTAIYKFKMYRMAIMIHRLLKIIL